MRKKEIGSEFWSVPIGEKNNKIFSDNISFHLSGRAALNAIIKDIKKTKNVTVAALPSWCCDSMIIPFLNNGIKVKFYSVIFENGELSQNMDEAEGADIILLMDYFGFIRQKDIETDAIVIRDLTHTVFCDDTKNADYYFGSLRKWAGFFTGGFAYSSNGHKIENIVNGKEKSFVFLREIAMKEKNDYLSGKNLSKEYLENFSKAEEFLDENFSGVADERDIIAARKIDVDFVKEKRRNNAGILMENLKDYAVFKELSDKDCPLFVPLYIENGKRDGLKKYLIIKNIYCPVHWPVSDYHRLNNNTRGVYENEISIICDQRYNAYDMESIVKEIKEFLD